ncbi:MAG: hypothetical protein Q7T68_06375 [Sphingopyxis sp.]|nr:hypothetical protein [Sphingopyxis sp.]
MRGHAFILAALLASPVPALADPIPDAADMDALEAKIPDQKWYPKGYYDVRVAAEAQVAEFPRPAGSLSRGRDAPYDVIDCSAEKVGLDANDQLLLRYGTTALETARMRSELERLGYPATITADPLLAFEKARITGVDQTPGPLRRLYVDLAAAMEANRLRVAPTRPRIIALGHCSGAPGVTQPAMAAKPPSTSKPVARRSAVRPSPSPPPPPLQGVTFSTLPVAGEVLLINAFAFKVCMRKQTNPWDRFACKWNEVETGVAKPLSGRFVYQVRWPDGTIRKGTREILSGQSGAAAMVTFRKTGS